MGRNYYGLVAGLREYPFDADTAGFDAVGLVEQVRGGVSAADRGHLRLFYTCHDIGNILSIKEGRSNFSALGNLSVEQLTRQIEGGEPEEGEPSLPRFIADILAAYADPGAPGLEDIDTGKLIAVALWEAFYDRCARSSCRFIREWYAFDRDLRNVSAAATARKMGLAPADALVGGGYVVEMLGHSSAADFGLRGELDYIDSTLSAIVEEGDMVEKERRIDRVRWEMADRIAQFDYFDIDALLAWLVHVDIIARWASLDPALGREMFRRLTAVPDAVGLVARAAGEVIVES